MFFRRMFSRKGNGTSAPLKGGGSNRHSARLPHSPKKLQRRSSSPAPDKRSLSVLQLTPLWEHIIRTRTLPDDLNPTEMFEEFLERLRDPEWQVRQHALRVLVDVLIVIGQKADSYFSPIIPQLVENLGHPAPTVRKGALDCLRVYVSNSGMPESVLLEILDIGLNQRITNEPFGGRLTCGVMLSLPSLVQATMHTPKRNYILRTTIDMLVTKMTQVTHQEITLKVLLRIKDLIGPREFAEYMSHAAYREFDLLCNVYGLDSKRTPENKRPWTILTSFESDDSESIWHPSDEGPIIDSSDNGIEEEFSEKIIMETEIKIKDDTLTMRIVETDSTSPQDRSIIEHCGTQSNCSGEDENDNDDAVLENSGLIHVLTDSEVDEINGNVSEDAIPRTPKRVTFGGEVVKMRTPDSDTVTHSDMDDISNKSASNSDKFDVLTVEILNDNTKPVIPLPKSRQTPSTRDIVKESPATNGSSSSTSSPISPKRRSSAEINRAKSASPRSPFRRISISPVDNIISPKPPHKEIEVLHNLQRSPTPSPGIRARRQNSRTDSSDNDEKKNEEKIESPHAQAKSWEDLNLVDQSVINGLKSGDWRHRLHAICAIEGALRSSDNLALVVPHLDSLFRTLLSSERNAEVAEDKRRIIMNLISRIPLDDLESRTNQLITGLCRQGGAGCNLVSKALMQRMPPAVIVLKLLSDEFLHARSSRFRENALQMVMFALMTFPSTCFDTATCVTRATYAALDRKKRVRQASLDVLAVLGQISSPRSVMEIVQDVVKSREDGRDLCTAVKARLARKQLPIINPDGYVQYALRVPSPQLNDPQAIKELGADIEWISSGVGSVSPTSMKRRMHKFQYPQNEGALNVSSFYVDKNRTNDDGLRRLRAPHEILGVGVGVKTFDDSGTSDEKGNIQHSLATGGPLQVRLMNTGTHSTGDIIGVHGKRIASKSCSDSSQDGRSSDSTGDNPRHLRSNVTSRFPAMERLDVTGIYNDRQSYRNLYSDYNAHRLNSTFPKTNFSVHQRKPQKNHFHQDAFTESSMDEAPYAHRHSSEVNASQNSRRFMNVDKFIMQSNKPPQQQQYQQQPLYAPSEGVHYYHYPHQLDSGRLVEQHSKKIETHPKVNEENDSTPPPPPPLASDSKTKVQSFLTRSDGLSNMVAAGAGVGGIGQFAESSELSSEERLSSGHSTPTRVLGDVVVTPISGQSDVGQLPRPVSGKGHQGSNKPTPPSTTHSAVSDEHKVAMSPEKEGDSEPDKTDFIQLKAIAVKEIEETHKEDEDNEFAKDITEIHSASQPEEEVKEQKNEVEELIEDITIEDIGSEELPLTIETPKPQEIAEEIEDIDEADAESHIIPEQESPVREVSVSTPKEEDIANIVENKEEEVESAITPEKPINILDELPSNNSPSTAIEVSPIPPIPTTPISPVPTSPIPTMEVKPITRESSLTKSSDSIFEPSGKIEGDRKSITSTETSSDCHHSHAASLDDPLPVRNPNEFMPPKPNHVPLMRKSKTTLFGRNRRISPVKQSIKLSKAEVFPQSLTRFDRPREALNQSIAQLDSSTWEIVMTGLRSLVRLIRYHPEVLDANMHMGCIQLAKAVKNLRSQVARAACQAATELFTTRTKHLEQECDDLVGNLLHRTADTNRFLRADASRALETMCDHLNPAKILHLLTTRGAAHQNAMVRTTTAKLLNRLADRMGCDRIFNMTRDNRDKFIITGANLLLEGSLETRCYAKALFRLLSSHHSYNRLLLEVIPSRTYRNIEKTLKSIK